LCSFNWDAIKKAIPPSFNPIAMEGVVRAARVLFHIVANELIATTGTAASHGSIIPTKPLIPWVSEGLSIKPPISVFSW
jgi:hypothetical protein